MPQCIRIHPADNVAVALCPIPAGTRLSLEAAPSKCGRTSRRDTSWRSPDCPAGENIIKYGYPIGHAASDIPPAHGCTPTMCARTCPRGGVHLCAGRATPVPRAARNIPRLPPGGRARRRPQRTLDHSHRRLRERLRQGLGRGRTRALSPVPSTAVCISPSLRLFPDRSRPRPNAPPSAALARHPNAGGVLVLSLGCENLTHEQFAEELGPYDPARVKFLTCQDVEDEMEAGGALLAELAAHAGQARREAVPFVSLWWA